MNETRLELCRVLACALCGHHEFILELDEAWTLGGHQCRGKILRNTIRAILFFKHIFVHYILHITYIHTLHTSIYACIVTDITYACAQHDSG